MPRKKQKQRRIGWSLEDLALLFGVEVNKAGQCIDPAIEKVALLLLADAEKTFALLHHSMQQRKVLDRLRLSRLPPMSPTELAQREDENNGRADRRKVRQ